MREPWWAKILAFLVDLFSGRQRALGRAEEKKKRQEAADALLQKFDEIGDDGRSLDDALDRMRRNQGKRDVPEP